MELQLTTARWTIRIARNKPAKPSPPAATQYPMRGDARQPGFKQTARPKDVR